MKAVIVGHPLATLHWWENTCSAFREAGCEVVPFSTKGNSPFDHVRLKAWGAIDRRLAEKNLAKWLVSLVTEFRPDFILFVAPFQLPSLLPRALREVHVASRIVGWVGDRLLPEHKASAELFDRLYFSDSGFLEQAAAFSLLSAGCYLPLAANPHLLRPLPCAQQEQRLVFVASPTPERTIFLKNIRAPLTLIGDGWQPTDFPGHKVAAQRLHHTELAGIYSSHSMALNLRNELNTLRGLNHRSFEPAACAVPVIHDAVADLEACFEPNREILVFHNHAELMEINQRIQDDPAYGRQIGANGRTRVLSDHTYLQRAKFILKDVSRL